MRAFRIGYTFTFSFLLVLMVVTTTFGFFPAPKGPKAPTYPTYSNSSFGSSVYDQQVDQYQKQQKDYQNQQKTFLQDKIVPYARNVFVSWLIILVVFQVIGMVAGYFGSGLVGGGFSFSGVWAVIFGPLGGLLWFSYSLISGLGYRAEEDFSIDPILQALGITCLISVIVLMALGTFLYGRVKLALLPVTSIPTPPSPQ